MTRSITTTFAALLTLATAGAHASTELITNGSFEADVIADNTYVTWGNLTGWTGGDHGIELRNNVVGAAYDGHNFVELDTTANSSMSQTVQTNAGEHYQLSFAYSPRQSVGVASNGIDVYWNNELIGTYSAKGGPNGNIWSTEVIDLTGRAGTSVLTFKAGGTSDSLGGSVDAVSLTSAVPEPETYAMLLAGLGMMGMVARRRQGGRSA